MAGEIVNAPGLGKPVGFSHAIVTGPGDRLVHLAGQTALTPEGEIVGETLVEQFDRAAANLLEALAAAGAAAEDIVSLQIFVTDVADYRANLRELGEVWRRRFGRHYPATGLFGVVRLYDEEARVELMGTAAIAAGEGE